MSKLTTYSFREKVALLESADGASGKLPETVDILTKLQEQQNELTKAVKDNEIYLKQISDVLEEMSEESVNTSIQDPYGKDLL